MQSAYRAYHSTETALLRINNDILATLDHGGQVALVMLDLSAAFETVDHDVLIDRLRTRYGFTGTALKWVKSYLADRSQTVRLRDDESSSICVNHGVPQGSVLGPILFNLYMGPLGDIISAHNLSYMTYADDSQIYVTVSSEASIVRLEKCIADIKTWMSRNKLKLNDSKTEFINFCSRFRSSLEIPGLTIGGSYIIASPVVKDLGISLDTNFTLDSHIKSVTKSALSSIRCIGRIRKYVDRSACEKLIHSFTISRLDYCNSLFVGLPGAKIKRLQRIQNTAVRLVMRVKKYDHISPILYELHWLPVQQRINYKVIITVFKSIHGMAPIYLSDLIQMQVPQRQLRSSDEVRLCVPRTKTASYGDRAFSVCGPKLWNSLPQHLRGCSDFLQFKSLLKTYLF
jgi:hypothetical protein